MQTENVVVANLLTNEDYFRKVIPYLEPEYFTGPYAEMVGKIREYSDKYGSMPSQKALSIMIDESSHIHEDDAAFISQFLENPLEKEGNLDWLVDETEKHCKQKAVFNAIKQSIQIIDGRDENYTPEALPDILSQALKVGFDTNIGHNYLKDAEARYDFYHIVEERIETDIDMLNRITKGGFPPKSLNVALAPTGVGKTLFMCHLAAYCLSAGYNVLYVTMEMAEERIAERIDANLMNIPLSELPECSKNMFLDRVGQIQKKTQGELIIREYPTASAHAGHIKALIEELELKQEFRPQIVFVDYLNICTSSRYKAGGGANSYTIIKSIAEEMRGVAVEKALPFITATQTNRGGFDNSDIDLTDTSESMGLPATADFFFALISTEELQEQGMILLKQLKNRYTDVSRNKRFMIGVDRSRMKLLNVDNAEEGLERVAAPETNSGGFDMTPSGERTGDFDGFTF